MTAGLINAFILNNSALLKQRKSAPSNYAREYSLLTTENCRFNLFFKEQMNEGNTLKVQK